MSVSAISMRNFVNLYEQKQELIDLRDSLKQSAYQIWSKLEISVLQVRIKKSE